MYACLLIHRNEFLLMKNISIAALFAQLNGYGRVTCFQETAPSEQLFCDNSVSLPKFMIKHLTSAHQVKEIQAHWKILTF